MRQITQYLAVKNKAMFQPIFQGGGSLASSFVTYESAPQAAATPAATKPAKDDTDQSKQVFDKLMSMISSLDGLPNDVQEVATLAQDLFATNSLYSNGELDYQSLMSTYLSVLTKVKQAKFNKSEYDKAYKEVTANGGLNEYAITSDGRVVVATEDGLSAVTLDKLDTKKHQPITNAQLLQYRAHSADFSFSNGVLEYVANGIGAKEVTNLIQKAAAHLGTSTTIQSGITKKTGESMENSLALLAQAQQRAIEQAEANGTDPAEIKDMLTLDGLYKNKLLTKSQTTQITAALNYLERTLPANAVTWLKLHSDGTAKGAKELMTQLITSQTSDTVDFSAAQGSQGKSKSGSGSDPLGEFGGNDKTKVGAAQAFLLGNHSAGNDETLLFQDSTSHTLPIHTFSVPMTDAGGKPLGETTLQDVQNNSQFGGILDFSQAVMGDQRIISPDQVVVNANKIYKMDLPIDEAEFKKTGRIIPDFSFLKRMEEVDNIITQQHITDPDQINQLYYQAQLPIKYIKDASGEHKLNTAQYRTFGGLKAEALKRAFEDEDAEMSPYLQEIDSENAVNYFMRIINGKQKGDKDTFKFDDSNWLGLAHGDDYLYEGVIFIPVRDNYINAMVMSEHNPYETEYNNYQQSMQAADARTQRAKARSQKPEYKEYTENLSYE